MKRHDSRIAHHKMTWPDPPLHVALVEPKIPQNTGGIARLCAATGCGMHLVGELGFTISDRAVRRAGLDYWDSVDPQHQPDFDSLLDALAPSRLHFFSTGGQTRYQDVSYRPGDLLVFGSETAGLPQEILDRWPDRVRWIPIRTDHVRSLNLAMSVGIVVYEALRQIDSPGVKYPTE